MPRCRVKSVVSVNLAPQRSGLTFAFRVLYLHDCKCRIHMYMRLIYILFLWLCVHCAYVCVSSLSHRTNRWSCTAHGGLRAISMWRYIPNRIALHRSRVARTETSHICIIRIYQTRFLVNILMKFYSLIVWPKACAKSLNISSTSRQRGRSEWVTFYRFCLYSQKNHVLQQSYNILSI